jgi:amidohydrolase
VAGKLLGDYVIDSKTMSMVSEDMAFVLQKFPGCYFLVGSANQDKKLNSAHHHPKFDFDEIILPQAAALMAASTMEFLGN